MLKTNPTDNDLIEFRRQVDIQLNEMMQDHKKFLQDFGIRLEARMDKLIANFNK